MDRNPIGGFAQRFAGGGLRAAARAAGGGPTAQRREIHAAISGELDRVNKDVLARLGVTS